MKLSTSISLSILLLQMFSCMGAEVNHQQIIPHAELMNENACNYFPSAQRMELIHFCTEILSCMNIDVTPNPIIKNEDRLLKELTFEKVCNYFPSPRVKYQFSDPHCIQLTELCKQKREALKTPITENKQIEILEQEIQANEQTIIQLKQNIDELAKATIPLQEEIAALESQKSKPIIQKNKPVIQQNKKNSPQQKSINQNKKLTPREKNQCYQLLVNKYSRNNECLLPKSLYREANAAFASNSSNFDKKYHLWHYRINGQYRCVYSPCTSNLYFARAQSPRATSEIHGCKETCQYYKNTESDSDEESKYVIRSKEEMEALGN